jgi:hypothetical protein
MGEGIANRAAVGAVMAWSEGTTKEMTGGLHNKGEKGSLAAVLLVTLNCR